jgi:hypothetical protein
MICVRPFSSRLMLSSDQGGMAFEPYAGLDHPAIRASPVPAMAGKRPDLTAVDYDQGAITVMLDLVNPPFSGGRFRHERREFRPDKAELGRR